MECDEPNEVSVQRRSQTPNPKFSNCQSFYRRAQRKQRSSEWFSPRSLRPPVKRFGAELVSEFLRGDEIALHVVAHGGGERGHGARVAGGAEFADFGFGIVLIPAAQN